MTRSDITVAAVGHHPAAVIWDLDGTLVESAPDLASALNTQLSSEGLATHAVSDVRLMIGGGVPKLIERGFAASGVVLNGQAVDSRVADFLTLYQACATNNSFLIPGARYALDRLSRAGVCQGLCTNKPGGVTRQITEALDITRYFGSIVGGDSTTARKPDPTSLLACLDELGVSARQAVMVGDSTADVGAARAAGVIVLVVPNGYTALPASELGADGIVGSIAEVPSALQDPAQLMAAD
ncbi:MAG: phosphoglycolate phosphatase [Xanthomonadales bacterium]|nr:phosphoglycolate phosphatase [Xanthomonadales bacterium]